MLLEVPYDILTGWKANCGLRFDVLKILYTPLTAAKIVKLKHRCALGFPEVVQVIQSVSLALSGAV